MTTATHGWYVTLPTLDLDGWLNFELSWSVNGGLEVYVNDILYGSSTVAITRTETVTVTTTTLFLGRSQATDVVTTTNTVLEEVTIFNATRSILVSLNVLLEGEYPIL